MLHSSATNEKGARNTCGLLIVSPVRTELTSRIIQLDATDDASVQATKGPDQKQDRNRHAEQPEQRITPHNFLHWFVGRSTQNRPLGSISPHCRAAVFSTATACRCRSRAPLLELAGRR